MVPFLLPVGRAARPRSNTLPHEVRTAVATKLHLLSCLDSEQMAASRRQELNIPRHVALALGRSAVKAARNGFYVTRSGQEVVWRDAVQTACGAKRSIAPTAALPRIERSRFTETRVRTCHSRAGRMGLRRL